MSDVEINEKIDQAILKLADQAKAQQDSQRALHYSQAALNLASAKSVLSGVSNAPTNSRKTN